ncbi:MAG: pilus assembly protein [Planctomycetota bacterium]|nr:MAG: pilus assembly protein [Planctomycetota bacterium]
MDAVKDHRNKPFRKGAATVELAVTLPLLVTLAFGTIEATNAIYLKQSLVIAAYEGARVAILPNTDETKVKAASQRILTARRVKNATITVSPSNYQNKPYGTPIQVTVSAKLSSNLISPALVLQDRTTSASVVMMKEQ